MNARQAISQPSIGWLRLFYPRLESTMDTARALANAEWPAGVAVVAGFQTHGRGRQSRAWEAPPDAALLCSVLLRPALSAERLPLLAMAIGLAATDAVTTVGAIDARLKWPNDLVVPHGDVPRHHKSGGLLVETSLTGSTIAAAIVGIGINLAWHPPSLSTATDLLAATGRRIARDDLLEALLAALDQWLAHLEAGEADRLFSAWRARLTTLGQRVRVGSDETPYEALAEEVDHDGALVVRLDNGERRRLLAADVTLSRDWLGGVHP